MSASSQRRSSAAAPRSVSSRISSRVGSRAQLGSSRLRGSAEQFGSARQTRRGSQSGDGAVEELAEHIEQLQLDANDAGSVASDDDGPVDTIAQLLVSPPPERAAPAQARKSAPVSNANRDALAFESTTGLAELPQQLVTPLSRRNTQPDAQPVATKLPQSESNWFDEADLQPFSPSEEAERAAKLEAAYQIEQARLRLEEEARLAAERQKEESKEAEQAQERDRIVQAIQTLYATKEALQARNAAVQSLLAEDLEKRKNNDANGLAGGEPERGSGADPKLRYANILESVRDLTQQHAALQTATAKTLVGLEAERTAKHAAFEQRRVELAAAKRQAVNTSLNSRTGKPLAESVVATLDAAGARRAAEVYQMRLENIKLRNLLRSQEDALRQKEELADGVHLIDFEQLKIENQTYNEKIEERNEELVRLRKTITKVVHILTHVKEKLAFVQIENQEARDLLRGLDVQVTTQRDRLPLLKQDRDGLRNATVSLKRKHGLMGHRQLLRDYENKADECEQLENTCNHLRARHAGISAELLALKRKVQKLQALRTLGSPPDSAPVSAL